MDTIQFIATTIIEAAAFVIGAYLYAQKREDRIMEKMTAEIDKIKDEVDGVKGNYVSRLDAMKEALAELKIETMKGMHSLMTSVQRIADKMEFSK